MRLTLSIAAFRRVFVGFIIIVSAVTLVDAWPTRPPLVVLASVEIVAALLFLVPRLEGVAGFLLLGVFAIAFALTGLAGENPARFVYYAATVLVLWRRPSRKSLISGRRSPL